MSTAVTVKRLTKAQARKLTNEVKGDAHALWEKLVTLYEGEAHTVLGYDNWDKYCETEFGMSLSRGGQLRRAGEVLIALRDTDPMQNPGGFLTAEVARELSPVVKKSPDKLLDVWTEVTKSRKQPTGEEVRAAVDRLAPESRPRAQRKGANGPTGTRALTQAQRDRDSVKAYNQYVSNAHAQARMCQTKLEGKWVDKISDSQADKWIERLTEIAEYANSAIDALNAE